MGYIKETTEAIDELIEKVRNLPEFVIYFLFSILMLSMYWFIGIFLFHRTFYLSNSLLITITISLGLSFIWYIINFIISAIQIEKLYSDDDSDVNSIFFVGGFISIIYLCLVIVILYFIKPYYEISIKTFLLISFSYIGFQLLRTCFLLLLPDKKKEKQKNAEK